MSAMHFSAEASALMERFISRFPAALRDSCQKKVLRGVHCQVLQRGIAEVTKEVLFEALEESFSKSFEPVILRLKDPQRLSDMAAAQKEVDRDNPLVAVRRWKLPAVLPDVPVEKVLALLAGPRKRGNTDCIMDALLDGTRKAGASVEKLCFSDLTISPCVGCMACEEKDLATYCALKDDMTGLYGKFLECDAFVLGFPIYTARECSQAAIFFDRLKALRSGGNYQKLGRQRKGALVVTWGWPAGDSYNHVVENAVFVLKLFGVDTAQIVTGSGFWDAYYKRGMAALDGEGMAAAREAGRALVTS